MSEPLGKDEKWTVLNTAMALVRSGNLLRTANTNPERLKKPREWTGLAITPLLTDQRELGGVIYDNNPTIKTIN